MQVADFIGFAGLAPRAGFGTAGAERSEGAGSHSGSAVYSALVRIIARRALREFWEQHPDAERPLRAWYHDVQKADWSSPADIKRVYANASIVGDNRVVFNIKGNTYRLVVSINYPYRVCYVRFVGSHQAYDRIDVASI